MPNGGSVRWLVGSQKAGTKCGGKGIPETASSDRSRRKEMFGLDRYLNSRFFLAPFFSVHGQFYS